MSIQKRTRLQSHLSILAGGALAREKADVKGRLNFSIKTTTAAKVPLTESLLDNWLKNNHITVDKIYYHSSLFASFLFTNFSFQNYLFLNRRKQENRILWQRAKIRLD